MKWTLFSVMVVAASLTHRSDARFASVKLTLDMTVAEDKHSLTEDMVRICMQETDISMAELEKFRKKDFQNPTESTKCFAHCIYEQMGLMRNGIFIDPDVITIMADLSDTKQFAFRECSDIKTENKCETAFKIHQCRQEVRNRGALKAELKVPASTSTAPATTVAES